MGGRGATIGVALTSAAVLAVGVEAVRAPSGFLAGLAAMTAAGVLLTAFLGIMSRRGARRAFWVGFAVAGWSYLALASGAWFLGTYTEALLLPSRLGDELHLAFHPRPATPPPGTAAGPVSPIPTWGYQEHRPIQMDPHMYWKFSQYHVRGVGHALAALMAAWGGGVLGYRLRAREASAAPAPAPARRGRVSIAGLMAVVSIVAVGLAALRAASGWTVVVAFTMAYAAVVAATIAALVLRGPGRVLGAGFALFAGMYLIAAFGSFEVRQPTFTYIRLESYLPTSRLFDAIFPWAVPAPTNPNLIVQAWDSGYHEYGPIAARYLSDLNGMYFRDVGHALTALVLGLVGGRAGARFAATAARPGEEEDR